MFDKKKQWPTGLRSILQCGRQKYIEKKLSVKYISWLTKSKGC